MSTSSTLSVDTTASPDQAYTVLANLNMFGNWLPTSVAYKGTTASSAAAVAGDTYTDHTSLGPMRGTVLEAEPGRRLVFSQAADDDTLSIRITYTIAPAGTGSRVSRTGDISTNGRLRFLHPVVVAAIRRENRRTMKELTTLLDRR